MAILEILKFPDPRLRTKAKTITEFNKELARIAEDMFETMYDARGVGLAGTQVNIHLRIFTMDVSEKGNERIVVCNPEIIKVEGDYTIDEGCLSVEHAWDKVKRGQKVWMRGQDIKGKAFELVGENLMAKCMQHEVDHLNGKLFIDHLSRLKQERIRQKIEKLHRRD